MLFANAKANKDFGLVVGYDGESACFKAIVTQDGASKTLKDSDTLGLYGQVMKEAGKEHTRLVVLAFRGLLKTMQVTIKILNLQRRSALPILKEETTKLKAAAAAAKLAGNKDGADKKSAKVAVVKKLVKKNKSK